ncbi:type VI secretion system baseplate subunit TssF [Herbaspirillum huttiense]|jgi:type VI secretion system protein ImpG|uniref:type VI secretion system baseplate subunit TssF n=1 Tax=Herbaspirillum huttiense TaxID=863372 RepID=UPI00034C9BFC|nr:MULTISPECIES: type VI secretion system baseplate subunit TssF [Herbaspirillum]UWE14279.1 type VI secretion system baseplate subunit TssF [Herbaspirillum huttiense]
MFNRYYEDELNKLKGLAVEFAQNNPALAPMLSGSSADPDVERLLEGVAFLTGLTRQKLDDEFPEFVQELANLLFPHYLRPVPASTMISFTPRGPLMETAVVPAGTELSSLPVDGTPCRFVTTAALPVEPLQLVDVNVLSHAGAAPMLVLEFEMVGQDLSQWQADSLQLFLGGGYNEAAKLLLLLSNHVVNVRLTGGDGARFELGTKGIRVSGFEQPMLPYPGNTFSGYRNIQEFFVQPEKFLFVELTGLQRWRTRSGSHFSVYITLDQMPDWMPEIRLDSFMLNVVPAINLFGHPADPISHEHRVTEYRITPEGRTRQHFQVYSVDEVTGYQQGIGKERVYVPFGLYRHDRRGARLSYRTTIRSATVGRGNEMFLSVNYPPGDEPRPETLSVRLTCTNGSLPESLKLGDISQPTSSSPDRMQFRNIRTVSPALNPPTGEALLWRMVSHVSLNFLSVANAENLQALLSLYVFPERHEQGQEAANRRRIEGIQEVIATPETRLVGRGSVLRGQRVRIKCRQDFFAGIGDMYLFGCVIERFIADYAGINSYTRVEMEDAFSGAVFKWPARLGQQALL